MAKLRRKGRSTGPTSEEGKKNSSRNSTKHGCRAKTQMFLPDESPDDYDEMRDGWMREFEPHTYAESQLVENLILNQWLLLRAQNRLLDTQYEAAKDKRPEAEHQVQLAVRYKTTAEREFYRSWNAAHQLRKETHKDAMNYAKALAQVEARAAVNREMKRLREQAEKTAAAQERAEAEAYAARMNKTEVPMLTQWIEITQKDGKTITKLVPKTVELLQQVPDMSPRPEIVLRRFFFPDGTPAEYEWSKERGMTLRTEHCGVQQMSLKTWLELVEREQARKDGIVEPLPDDDAGPECGDADLDLTEEPKTH